MNRTVGAPSSSLQPARPIPARQLYTLALLSLVLVVNMVDRQLINILLDPIKRDLGVSDTAMGLMTGTAFSLFYVAASVPMAKWGDRGVRRSILAGGVVAWSLCTALSGLAQSFVQLALARAGVAVTEAGASPLCQSLVSDIFSRRHRATVLGILTAASSLGAGCGLFLGGWINDAFNWRVAFFIVGAPGILLGVLVMFTVIEPAREAAGQPDHGMSETSVIQLVRNPMMVRLLWVSALAGITTYAMYGWGATFLLRVHHMSTTQVGLWLGLATIVGQAGGHVIAGFLSDRLARRDMRWYAWYPALGTLLAIPFGCVFLFASDPAIAIGSYAVFQIFKSSWASPTLALAFAFTEHADDHVRSAQHQPDPCGPRLGSASGRRFERSARAGPWSDSVALLPRVYCVSAPPAELSD